LNGLVFNPGLPMKVIALALGATSLLALTACAPQGRPVGFPSSISMSQRLSVVANGELRVGFYVGGILDDCSIPADATVRTIIEPANGRLAFRKTIDVPHLIVAAGTAKAKCAGRRYPGTLVTYRPTPGFTGEDTFGIDVIWPSGASFKRTISVQVR
jgi:hypothetical protein